MTKLVRLDEGIGRVLDETVELISTSHADLAAMFADGNFDAAAAPAIRSTPLAEVQPLRPVLAPSQIVIVGLNYHAHAAEIGAETPTRVLFIVCEGGPGIVTEWDHPIAAPDDAPSMIDYEGELGLVIGSIAENISAADAWQHVGGVVVLNDVSARDVQKTAMAEATAAGSAPTVGMAKTYPTFKPMGSVVFTPEELDVDGPDLELTTFVNGEERQRGRLTDLIFGVPEILEAVSHRVALQPGDLICTGTPGGVGMSTDTYLMPGDVVEVTIEGLGSVRNVLQ